MWRRLFSQFGGLIHPGLERKFIPQNGCHGVVATRDIGPAEPLAFIPFWACVAPNIALASPWGQMLRSSFNEDFTRDCDGARIEISAESMLTTAFTALASQNGGPISAYISSIQLDHAPDEELGKHLTVEQLLRLRTIRTINDGVVRHIHSRMSDCGLTVALADVQRSFTICESRCVDVPNSDAILGGPALVPFVDMLNHGDGSEMVHISIESGSSLNREAQHTWCSDIANTKTPFYVVSRAISHIPAGAELTYAYVDPLDDAALYNDPLYWISRFHFFPAR